jgi:hypothetical protein
MAAQQQQAAALQQSEMLKNMGQAVGQETMANAVGQVTDNALEQ